MFALGYMTNLNVEAMTRADRIWYVSRLADQKEAELKAMKTKEKRYNRPRMGKPRRLR